MKIDEILKSVINRIKRYTSSAINDISVNANWDATEGLSHIKNKPTSLPAEGGNADTVSSKHLWTGNKLEFKNTIKNNDTIYMIYDEKYATITNFKILSTNINDSTFTLAWDVENPNNENLAFTLFLNDDENPIPINVVPTGNTYKYTHTVTDTTIKYYARVIMSVSSGDTLHTETLTVEFLKDIIPELREGCYGGNISYEGTDGSFHATTENSGETCVYITSQPCKISDLFPSGTKYITIKWTKRGGYYNPRWSGINFHKSADGRAEYYGCFGNTMTAKISKEQILGYMSDVSYVSFDIGGDGDIKPNNFILKITQHTEDLDEENILIFPDSLASGEAEFGWEYLEGRVTTVPLSINNFYFNKGNSSITFKVVASRYVSVGDPVDPWLEYFNSSNKSLNWVDIENTELASGKIVNITFTKSTITDNKPANSAKVSLGLRITDDNYYTDDAYSTVVTMTRGNKNYGSGVESGGNENLGTYPTQNATANFRSGYWNPGDYSATIVGHSYYAVSEIISVNNIFTNYEKMIFTLENTSSMSKGGVQIALVGFNNARQYVGEVDLIYNTYLSAYQDDITIEVTASDIAAINYSINDSVAVIKYIAIELYSGDNNNIYTLGDNMAGSLKLHY